MLQSFNSSQEQLEQLKTLRPAKPTGEKCPVCQARIRRQHQMHIFHNDILSFLQSNRVVKYDSCMFCVKKHVGSAMQFYTEMLRANGSGNKDGEARVNVFLNQLKLIGHLQAAIEESQDFPELHQLLIQEQRNYRYEGIEPNWPIIAQKMLLYVQQKSDSTSSDSSPSIISL